MREDVVARGPARSPDEDRELVSVRSSERRAGRAADSETGERDCSA